MQKYTIFSLLMLSAALSYAENEFKSVTSPATKLWMKSQGLPIPDGGIILKPESQLVGYEEHRASIESDDASIKKYGYKKRDSTEIQSLLNFAKGNRKWSVKDLTSSADTGLFGSVNDIQMAYAYRGVPKSAMTKEIAIAPAGTYINSDDGKGWTGAVQIFANAGIGTCNYVQTNAKLNHSSVFVAQEKATYDVNGKVTVKDIQGEEGKGFMYSVKWFDDNFYHELKCGQRTFSTMTMPAVINLAIATDNNLR